MQNNNRRQRQRRPMMEKKSRAERIREEWVPRTELGKKVLAGEISNIEQIYSQNKAILEPEIVDLLLPDLKDEVLKVNMVQRTTDSGRKGSFSVTVAVGNKNGHIGVGVGKGLEVKVAIERAIKNAKKNLIHIRRGCGSWECGCEENHSVPFKVKSKYGSVSIELLPAPKGTGIVAGNTAKKVLELAGIKDVWSKSIGKTSTRFNFAFATLGALKETRKSRFTKKVGDI